jgi:hypothetical protein
MELKKALELQVNYYGSDGVIRVDENGYICLNDFISFFPNKDMSNWARSTSTIEFIQSVENEISNSVKSTELKQAVITKRGRYKSGTYAHKWVATHFAMWLSAEFSLIVIRSFEEGTQNKQDWNIKRILAANNYKLMCEAIKNDHENPKHYHFSNEALMLNEIVFGVRSSEVRESATEQQLDAIAWLESRNGAYIEIGMDYQERKKTLLAMYETKYLPKLTKELENDTQTN